MKEKAKTDKKKEKKRLQGFQVVEEECIWMKAGVVSFRLCDNAYDCYNCPFDKGMKKAMGLETSSRAAKEEPGWVAYLKKTYHGASRPCRHALTGRVNAPKICPNNYECYHCPYDQMLDEYDLAQLASAPQYHMVSGYRMPAVSYTHLTLPTN